MKKLTAGIFASLLAVVATGAAHAEIASKGYVDDQVDTVEATVATKADKSALDTLSGTVTEHTTQIAGKADKATTLAGYGITDGATKTELAGKVNNADITDMQVKANLTTNAEWATEKASDDKYPSNAAVDAAISEATSKLPTSGTITEIQGNITKIQGDVAGLKTSKQDADTAVEVGTAGTAVGSTTQPVYVNESGVVTPTNALGSLAWESTVGTAEIENNAVTTAKIGNAQVTAEKIAAGVIPSVSTQLTTGNTAAAQAGAVANALAGKADSSALANYVTTTTANSTYQTQANLVKTEDYDSNPTTASDTQYPSEKAVATAISEISTNVEGLGALAHKDTIDSATLLGAGVVTTDKLAADAVTNAKLADDAVQAANIATGAVGADAIAANAVTTAKIADGTITNADISDTAEIAMAKIAGLEEALAGVIEKPEGCQGVGSDCVLVIKDGTIQWEDVARGTTENSN